MAIEEEEEQIKGKRQQQQQQLDDDERMNGTLERFVPLSQFHSSNVRDQLDNGGAADIKGQRLQQTGLRFYSRRSKTLKKHCPLMADANLQATLPTVKEELVEIIEKEESMKQTNGVGGLMMGKRKMDMRGSNEQMKLEFNLRKLRKVYGSRGNVSNTNTHRRKRHNHYSGNDSATPNSAVKRWVKLMLGNDDANKLVGLQCKIYWPLDDKWYIARLNGYNTDTGCHQIVYDDGEEENLILSREKVKFFISGEELQRLSLSCSTMTSDIIGNDFSEMIILAADSFNDSHELGPGDITWAKLTGHPAWPALVLEEDLIVGCKGLSREKVGQKSYPVQFFGSHDFARVNMKQVSPFLRGLLSSFQLKCKKPDFVRGLEEAKKYLSEQKLPERMLLMQNNTKAEVCESISQDDEDSVDLDQHCLGDEDVQNDIESSESFPLQIGDLQVLNLGKIVDSKHFQNVKSIWPERYTAVRKLPSLTDPSVSTSYKMEVMRDTDRRTYPLFKVTLDTGEQFKGSTPSSCWKNVYNSINDTDYSSYHSFISEGKFRPGSDMFGFSCPEVLKLIKKLSSSKASSKSNSCKMSSGRSKEQPSGYRPVRVKWNDLDKCNVCHMDDEYEDNLFLQCDKCRMMVHARCYGELEPVDGVIWLCQLCRPDAPKAPIRCCLCPVIGGAMKRTTDGQWAHLACAIWIPETCLSDIKKMEPIYGIDIINKDRWKLLCCICGVAYGACIQCSSTACRVAYHPLCARAEGLCEELADEGKYLNMPMDVDEDEQCIPLFSFCKKHRPVGNGRSRSNHPTVPHTSQLDYTPPINPSGCARTEPYNWLGRRGRKEPEVLAAASLKRSYVENRPYLVSGYSQHEIFPNSLVSSAISLKKLNSSQLNSPGKICSMAEKYRYMSQTFKQRLAFGKSRIHGYGIFTKLPHRAGDMVIEYTGDIVRPSIADRREHLIYNSLVGAGTYMFRIDNERVIDATRTGSVAHLINHSCDPNCYSRVINTNGDQHIIIYAKRDLKQWEELSYDYRFFSKGEQLACYCGAERCRGVVNDAESEAQASTLCVQRKDLIEWKGE
ncbi:histone-lysine N-methyltransferase ATX2-like [Impatiens glandulifera]|uniref:histone-lysine N-methyltransferase ATX2-like n=1 Tax=Impatiens glandulifera TaxID=253017 RepID=UPI001FB10ED7|nr:histone-lysine N-methyltransferase ATX2-like [Impatiens glandulifera]